jgi:hypothetical protein
MYLTIKSRHFANAFGGTFAIRTCQRKDQKLQKSHQANATRQTK